MILATVGESVQLTVTLSDGAEDRYPRGFVYNSSGTQLATVDLTHVANGFYRASYVIPGAETYTVVYIVYDDAARTITSFIHGRGEEVLVANVPDQTACHLAVALDEGTDIFDMSAWLVRGGVTVTSPTSCTITFRNPNGTTLFSETSSSPQATGVFLISRSAVTLSGDETYYAEVAITDSTGTITTIRGVPTVK